MADREYSHIAIASVNEKLRLSEGYVYDDRNLALIRAMAPCTVVQYYTDGGQSNKIFFEKQNKQT